MKKLLILGMFIGIGSVSREQGAAIVYDPTNGLTMSNVLSTIKDLKETSDSWRANAEFLENIMNEGKEVKRLVAMLENLVCATDELDIYLRVDKSFELCQNKLELDITLGKIEGVNERIKLIATGAIALSQYETIESLKDLNDQLEDAIRQTNQLNSYMRRRVINMMREDYEAEHFYENSAMGTQFNVN